MNKYHVAFLATIPIQAIIYATIWKYYQYVEYAMIILSWLAFACVFGLVGYMACMGYWRIQDRKTGVDLKRAKVALRMAKAKRLDQIVTVIKPGHHIAITHTNPIKSITYAAPPLPLADKVSTINQIAAPTSDANIMDGVRMGEGWIKEVLFNDDGGLKVHHVSVNGPTGAGKTWFMLYMMWLLQQPHPSAEYWLLDPKFEGEESGWPFDPFVSDFDDVPMGLEYIYAKVVTTRKHAKRVGNQPTCPAFFIVDEVDGCFSDHKTKFADPLKKIIKESRSAWGHCFIAGQSSLVQDSGLNGSIYRNMARFVMGTEALAFTRNGQFTFWEKADRDIIAKQLIALEGMKRRAALVIPPSGQGLPFVGEIPHLPKRDFNQAAPVSEASKMVLALPASLPTMDLSSIDTGRIAAMAEAYQRGDNLTSVAAIGYKGQGDGQNIRCLESLERNGVLLRPEHVEKLAKYKGKS